VKVSPDLVCVSQHAFIPLAIVLCVHAEWPTQLSLNLFRLFSDALDDLLDFEGDVVQSCVKSVDDVDTILGV
jgi:hypothetical protein